MRSCIRREKRHEFPPTYHNWESALVVLSASLTLFLPTVVLGCWRKQRPFHIWISTNGSSFVFFNRYLVFFVKSEKYPKVEFENWIRKDLQNTWCLVSTTREWSWCLKQAVSYLSSLFTCHLSIIPPPFVCELAGCTFYPCIDVAIVICMPRPFFPGSPFFFIIITPWDPWAQGKWRFRGPAIVHRTKTSNKNE